MKDYGTGDPGRGRYAPPSVKSISKRIVCGEPEWDKIGTSRVERSNWTVRTMQRRFTRLAAGFSRKLENLRAACALHFAYYNFVWQVWTLKDRRRPWRRALPSGCGASPISSRDARQPGFLAET